MKGSQLLTTGEVATRARVSRTTVHYWHKDGKLAAAQVVNGMRLFDLEAVDAFLAEREGAA